MAGLDPRIFDYFNSNSAKSDAREVRNNSTAIALPGGLII